MEGGRERKKKVSKDTNIEMNKLENTHIATHKVSCIAGIIHEKVSHTYYFVNKLKSNRQAEATNFSRPSTDLSVHFILLVTVAWDV